MAATGGATLEKSFPKLFKDSNLVFDDTFSVQVVDHQRFEKVGRVTCKSMLDETAICVDVNTDVFPLEKGDHVHIVLMRQITVENKKTEYFDDHDPRVLGTLPFAKFLGSS